MATMIAIFAGLLGTTTLFLLAAVFASKRPLPENKLPRPTSLEGSKTPSRKHSVREKETASCS